MGSRQHFFTLVSFLLISTPPAAGQVRLAGPGSTPCSGRVEIYYNNEWGTVCDDDWGLSDAKVVCRQLNCGTALEAPQSAHFRPGTGPIWLDNVACSGSERSLTQCQHRGFGKDDCNHNEDAGVVCSDVQIRLAGSTLCSGRVEIYHNGAWGTVCDDDWGLSDAKVVCRQLNCGTAVSATQSALFGEGSGEIWLDDMTCSGSESSLTLCGHQGFGTHNCGHSEDAGVVCSVSLPKSSINMSPSGEVAWGQELSITCSTSGLLLDGTFILQQTSGSFRKTQTSSTNSATFSITKVDFDHEGSYQCQFEKSISDQTFTSSLSDPVRLSVTVSLLKPTIGMNPPGEVAWGQSIGIVCSISTQHLGGTFILQQTSGSLRKIQTSTTNSATFNLLKVDFDNEGLYQCQYQKRFSSRQFTSPLSDSARLIITVELPRPNISLTIPHASQVWDPEGAVVTWGYSFNFTCSINSSYPGGRFILIFSGSVIDSKSAVNNSATFNFPAAEYEHQGHYSCVYEVTLSSRNFNATTATPISVIIKVSLLLLASSVTAGILLLLLLLVLVVVCLVRRGRRRAEQPVVFIHSQMATRGSNTYDSHENSEDDYVNVDQMDTKKNLKEEAGRVVEEDSDDDDYENAIPDENYTMSKDIYVSVEDNGEEDESSDDENDYENVTPLVVNETDDIYQNF